MFSQFRNAVEQLAQPIRDAASHEDHSNHPPSRSGSLDIQAARSASPLSSSELADSALSSLRKSLVAQRSGSVPPPKAPTPPVPVENGRPRKSNLEERLRRAAVAIGDVSGSTTPGTTNRSSRVGSPSSMSSDRRPMPPKVQEHRALSTPLPSSPMALATSEDGGKLEQPSNIDLEVTTMLEGTNSSNSSEIVVDQPPIPQTSSPVDEPPPAELQESSQESEPSSTIEIDGTAAQLEMADSTSPPPISAAQADVQTAALDDEIPPVADDTTSLSHDTPNTEPAAEEISSAKEENSVQEETHVEETDKTPETEIIRVSPEIPLEAAAQTLASQISMEKMAPPKEITAESEEPIDHSPKPSPIVDNTAELESVQARLKQVEQRFSDVSTSFKRLQAEKLAADAVLRESTPLESIKDTEGLREFLSQIKTKEQVMQDEIKRLNQKLEVQEDRIEELRDTHRLESQSRSADVNKLKAQIDETEALFQAAQRATTHAEETVGTHKAEIAQLEIEVEKAKTGAKEEEEKRVKAISLLKSVRQKLVKADKDKDDALRELASIKEREQGEKNKEQADRQNFQREIEALTATHEQATANLRAQFNKDFASMQERYKQEISALRGQFELDAASAKSTYTKELGAKSSQITTLENSLNNVTRDKNAFFEQLQLRQAELESAQAHLESIQHQNTEFQFQLREANDKVALLKEECSELLREHETRSRDPGPSAEEIARMVSATEAKYESKLSELKRNLGIMEKERHESESDWSRKLKEKVKELEDLKRILGSAAKTREADENVVANLKAELAHAQQTAKSFERQLSDLPPLRDQVNELEKMLKEQEKESNVKILVFEKQLEDLKTREAQMKQSNKVLRDELRKVQSSAALLERQRNPGVGYWTTRDGNGSAAEPRTSNASQPNTPARAASPAPSTASVKNEEEVNLEYLRNVILQFLEHKEMRPNLVKVLSIILHFTPQETRRLIAKV